MGRPAFAGAASRRQAQGFSEGRTGPSAHHFTMGLQQGVLDNQFEFDGEGPEWKQ